MLLATDQPSTTTPPGPPDPSPFLGEFRGDIDRRAASPANPNGPTPLGAPMAGTRTETDSLGPREVPADAYYGIQTLRAVENFPVSGLRGSKHLRRAYALVKLACARANVELGVLDARRGAAIETAA